MVSTRSPHTGRDIAASPSDAPPPCGRLGAETTAGRQSSAISATRYTGTRRTDQSLTRGKAGIYRLPKRLPKRFVKGGGALVSISDVAQRAGVSSTTVSHTLSGKRFVSPQIKTRVQEAMAVLGYVPSRSARNLALGKTSIVGLLVPDVANGFFADLAKGVEHTAIEAGYNVILGNTGFDRGRELLYFEMIRSRAADGIIYAAGADTTISDIRQTVGDLPLVMVDEDLPDATAPTVVSDNYDGGRQAAAHLLRLGHRDALVLAAAPGLLSSSRRVAGFIDTWRDGGGHEPKVTVGSFTHDGGAQAVRDHQELLRSRCVSSIFAVNDLAALGAITELRSLGLTIPDDISVVGFDDSVVTRYCDPALTTVRQDVWGLGERAASVLIDALSVGEAIKPGRQVLGVELVVRDSTAPPSPATRS